MFPLIILGVIISLLAWIRIKKIPVFCLACEEGGTFTRCISGTGKGSEMCDAYKSTQVFIKDVENKVTDISKEFTNVKNKMMIPVNLIANAVKELESAFKSLSFSIPSLPKLEIPDISNFSCGISFDGFPKFDPCVAVNGAINGAVVGLNVAVDGIEATIHGIVGGINKATSALGWGTLPIKPLERIPKINTECTIDIAKALKDVKIDVCQGIITGLNVAIVKPFNAAIGLIKQGLNIAIEAINYTVKTIINFLKDAIISMINTLKRQLESLNIFYGIFDKIASMYGTVKSFNFLYLVQTYILPYLQAVIPFTSLMDAVFIVLIFISIPFIITIVIMLFILIGSISDIMGFINGGGGGSKGDSSYPPCGDGIDANVDADAGASSGDANTGDMQMKEFNLANFKQA